MKLKVEEANWDETFTDTVRIAANYRKTASGNKIENGSLVRIDHGRSHVLAVARGLPNRNSDRVISIDEFLRRKLGDVRIGDEIEVTLKVASWWDQLRWYRKASSPAVRIPAWVALISLGLGLLSVVLGGASLLLTLC